MNILTQSPQVCYYNNKNNFFIQKLTSGLDDIESSSAQEEGCDSNFISVEAETLPRKSLDSQNAGGSKLPSKNNGTNIE